MNTPDNNKAINPLIDKIKVWPQYLLPHYLLTDLMFFLTRSKLRVWKNIFIRWFIHQYRVDMSLAVDEDPTAYGNFNQFFTRPLKAEARPVCSETNCVACPVDGTVSQSGMIDNESIFQAKGHDYSLTQLLASQTEWIDTFRNGSFATIYLSPKDYHRIHMPIAGELKQMTYVPGKLFSVSPATTREIPGLFARNERVLCLFDTAMGPMAVILVGAMIVGSIETVWHGVITPPHGKHLSHWHYSLPDNDSKSRQVALKKGDELGRFNMGSTVILLFAQNRIQWDTILKASTTVEMGKQIAIQTT
ncbi:archaetidylserine decarboxylase [Kaarinaea lacus]